MNRMMAINVPATSCGEHTYFSSGAVLVERVWIRGWHSANFPWRWRILRWSSQRLLWLRWLRCLFRLLAGISSRIFFTHCDLLSCPEPAPGTHRAGWPFCYIQPISSNG